MRQNDPEMKTLTSPAFALAHSRGRNGWTSIQMTKKTRRKPNSERYAIPNRRQKGMKFSGVVIASCARFLAVFLVAAPLALGQTESAGSPYQLQLKSDLAVLAMAGGVALIPGFLDDHVDRSCPCSPSEVNALDRGTAGRRSISLNHASNIAVSLAVALPAALILVDSRTGGGALADGLVTGEAVLVNLALNQLMKVAVQRPRPLVYGLEAGDSEIKKSGNYLSFYSQHTSMTFAAGLSYARTFALRHPQSPRRWLVYTAAVASGVTVGTLRVLSGKHFPTDVVTGAVAGGAIGMLVPWLHPKRNSTLITFSPVRSGAMLSLRLPID